MFCSVFPSQGLLERLAGALRWSPIILSQSLHKSWVWKYDLLGNKECSVSIKSLDYVELNLSSVLENQPWLRNSPTVVEFWDTSGPKDHLALMYPDIRLVFYTSEETPCPLSLMAYLLSSSTNSTLIFVFFSLRGSVHQWTLPDFSSVNELILLVVCWILSFTYLILIKISCEMMKRYMGAMSNSMYHFWHSEARIRIYFK